MIKVKAVQTFRDKNNTIIGYSLADSKGNVKKMKSQELKRAIKAGKIEVINLTLTSDNRLVSTKSKISVNANKKKQVVNIRGRVPDVRSAKRNDEVRVHVKKQKNPREEILEKINASEDGSIFDIVIKGNEIVLRGVKVDKDSLRGKIKIPKGVKDFAVTSDGKVYKNINKGRVIKKLEKQKKRLQRQVSRKYEMNKQGQKFSKTENIKKLEQRIRLLERRIYNIRNTYIHEVTKDLVRNTPKKIVIEDLNVKGMMKNKHLSRLVQQQCFYKFRQYLTYKCQLNGVKLEIADRYYPSSKICSCCGSVKKQLSLSERTYKCDKCGQEINRDYNASINLSRYNKDWKKIVRTH